MKKLSIIIISLLCLGARAQALDTLFTNENHNVALFFPEKIRQAVVGGENFVFTYNQEHPQFFGLLKGSPGKSSNLLAITQDGQIYSYILSYREGLPKLIYFLNKKASRGNEIPEVDEETSSSGFSNFEMGREVDSLQRVERLKKQSAFYYSMTTGYLKKKKKDGILLQVNNMTYNGGEVYVVFEVANNSGIDFEPEYLRLFLSQGIKKRNASYQKLLQEPLLKYNLPDMIRKGQRKRFVYVFPKFTVGDREKMKIELREKFGNRLLQMNLKH